jgi:regulatory protein
VKTAEDFLQKLGIEPTTSGKLLVEDGFAEVQALSKQIESRAVYLLAMREHGAKELKTKLVTKFPETPELLESCKELPGLVKSLIDDVLKKCQDNNWQSDERYIELAVRNWAAKGSGPVKIRQKLQQASYRSDLITMYLDWDESEWLELAKDVLIKKYGDTCKPEARNEQAKRMRFLQSRGFAPHVIWQAFG